MKVSLFVLCSLAACNFGRAADCADPRSSQEVAQCLEQSLRSADAHINETYAAVMAKLNVPGQQRLRKDQLGWIRRRDAGCGLDSRNLTQEGWYRLLLTQYDSAVCVTRYTENRSTYLDGLLRSVSTSREAASTKTPTNPPPPESRAPYESISQTGRQTGLWYFELAIWPLAEKVANPLNVAAIWVGCRRPHWHGGATARLIPAETYVPVRVGVALDLNAGKMYLRGEYGWLNDGAPGSSAGIDVKLGQLYRCGVESAMPLQSLLNDQTLDLNYGKHAFYYPIPDGYRPFVEGGT